MLLDLLHQEVCLGQQTEHNLECCFNILCNLLMHFFVTVRCMYVCNACMYVCMHVCMYVYVCMYVCQNDPENFQICTVSLVQSTRLLLEESLHDRRFFTHVDHVAHSYFSVTVCVCCVCRETDISNACHTVKLIVVLSI